MSAVPSLKLAPILDPEDAPTVQDVADQMDQITLLMFLTMIDIEPN
jgi:hypothetical protein